MPVIPFQDTGRLLPVHVFLQVDQIVKRIQSRLERLETIEQARLGHIGFLIILKRLEHFFDRQARVGHIVQDRL